jgi:hypothetical protein
LTKAGVLSHSSFQIEPDHVMRAKYLGVISSDPWPEIKGAAS